MDSTTRARIQSRLVAEIDVMPKMLQQVAKYISDNPADFGLDTIRRSADKIGVSANTLVRMAQYLGFSSFDELREPFRQTLVVEQSTDAADDWLSRMAANEAFGARQAKIVRNEMSVLNRSLRQLNLELAQSVVDELSHARNAFITATRSSYALAHYFHYVGRMAIPGLQLVPRHMGSPIDDMASIDNRDVLLAITFTPYSAETIQALKFANKCDAKVILLSDSELIAPNIKVDHLLRVETHSTHHFACYVGAMAVLETLLGLLMSQGDAEVVERIARYEDLREDIGAYWKAKLPRIRR